MEKEKVVFFLDFANIDRAAREKGFHLDYHHLLEYVGEHRFLSDAYCYVPINPRNEHRTDRQIENLWRSGYIVSTKLGTIAGGTYKCNFDVEITMDMLKVVYQIKPDIIVLASGDSDFVPLIQEVRKSGVRVEVAAFEESTGADVLLKSSSFIDLAVYYEDYLAAQQSQQDEVEERYRNLIREQNDEQNGESNEVEQDDDDLERKTEHEQDLLEPQSSRRDEQEDDGEDHVNVVVDEVSIGIPAPLTDIAGMMNELGL